MVRGAAIAATAVPGRYQCADTDSTARGRGRRRPSAAQARLQSLSNRVFIGLPCPRKIVGSGAFMAGPVAAGASSPRLYTL